METLILSAQISPAPLRFHRRASPPRRAQSLRFRRHIVAAAAAEASPSETSEPQPKSPNRMFIMGMGPVAQLFAADFKNKGWDVQTTCETTRMKRILAKKGFGAHIFNPSNPKLSTLNVIKGCTHLLVCIPSEPDIGDPMLQHKELLRREIKNGDLKWLCYLSTTGVYGDHGGAWVDEDSTTNLQTENDKMILAAEEEWLKIGHGLGLSSFAFRRGGIYGPGGNHVDIIRKDGAYTEGELMRFFTNLYTPRVHIEDVCQALEASIVKPSDRNVFNIVDDDPTPDGEVVAYAQDLVHKRWPGRMRSPIPVIQERNTEQWCRVSNARMKNELGVSLRYPSYIEGLQSIIDQMEDFPF